jgi:NitT/TauT family transport system substrate-binding protein
MGWTRFLAIVAASVVFAGLPARADVPARVEGDGGIVRLPTNQNATQVWHLAAMEKYHLDTKYGFHLQIVPSATTQMTANAIESGSADIGIFGWIDVVRLRNAGVKIIGSAPFLRWGADHIILAANVHAKTLADLKGKRIGTFSRSNIDWVLDEAVAKTVYHLDMEKDFTVQEGAVGLLRGLVESGQLDATHMYNNLTPAIVVTGKAHILYQMREEIQQLGLPLVPQLFYATTEAYLGAHPQNVRAFAAAYAEAVGILDRQEDIWQEKGRALEMTAESIVLLRDEMREDLLTKFKPTDEAGIRKVFEFLLAQAGPQVLGFSKLPSDFMTLDYQ